FFGNILQFYQWHGTKVEIMPWFGVVRILYSLSLFDNLCTMKNRITLLVFLSFFLCHFSNAQVNFIRQQNVPVQVGPNTLVLPWAGGLSYPMFSEFDFNQDGIMDLFCFDRANNRIVPFINAGTANQINYTYAPEYVQYFPLPRM